MKLEEIVDLFQYDTDEVKAKVLIEYRDRFSGETSPELRSFMTKSVKHKMLDIYAEKQREEFREKKEAGVDLTEEFASIVSALKDDKILTLSSCLEYGHKRVVLHAKLINKEENKKE